MFGIARRICDRAQDIGAGALLLAGETQFVAQPRVVLLQFRLPRGRFVALGVGRFQARLHVGDGRFQLIDREFQIDRHAVGKRRHYINPGP